MFRLAITLLAFIPLVVLADGGVKGVDLVPDRTYKCYDEDVDFVKPSVHIETFQVKIHDVRDLEAARELERYRFVVVKFNDEEFNGAAAQLGLDYVIEFDSPSEMADESTPANYKFVIRNDGETEFHDLSKPEDSPRLLQCDRDYSSK